jgi:hypothetical protein
MQNLLTFSEINCLVNGTDKIQDRELNYNMMIYLLKTINKTDNNYRKNLGLMDFKYLNKRIIAKVQRYALHPLRTYDELIKSINAVDDYDDYSIMQGYCIDLFYYHVHKFDLFKSIEIMQLLDKKREQIEAQIRAASID